MKKRPRLTTDSAPLSSNPFAGLLVSAATPAVPDPGALPPSAARAPHESPDSAGIGARLLVRRQKKGQGGKTVTCVEGIEPSRVAAVLEQVKRELGCSGRLDGAVLIVGTGEHARVAQWLRDAGAPTVVLGN